MPSLELAAPPLAFVMLLFALAFGAIAARRAPAPVPVRGGFSSSENFIAEVRMSQTLPLAALE